MSDAKAGTTEQVETGAPRLSLKLDGGIAAGLALLALLVVLPTIPHYGLTYDEGWYGSTAARAREWAGLLVTSPGRALSRSGLERYWAASRELPTGEEIQEQQPGAPKLVDGVLGYPLGRLVGAFPAERAGTALFLAAGVVALYLLMAPVWGRGAGIFASLALMWMPRVFAHAHLVALDVPVMSAGLVSVALMFAAVAKRRFVWALLAGLAWGIGLACKINAVFVPLILAAWILWLHRDFACRAALGLIVGGVVAFVVSWPWLWIDTFAHVRDYFAFHLRHYRVATAYFGVVSGEQPWHYPSVMTAITTPPVTLLLALAGAVIAGLVIRRRRDETDAEEHGVDWQRSLAALLLIGLVLNIAFNSLPSAPKYNGVRLFLPMFPFLAALAALAFRAVAMRLTRDLPERIGSMLTPARVRGVIGGVLLAPSLLATLGTHPYQMSYYNELIGGLDGAVRRGMEATYWGDTYLAAMGVVSQRARPGETVWIDLPGCEWIANVYAPVTSPPVRVCSGGAPPPETSWAIVQNKLSELRPETEALIAAGPPAAMVDLNGVPLAYVFDHAGVGRGLTLLGAAEPPMEDPND